MSNLSKKLSWIAIAFLAIGSLIFWQKIDSQTPQELQNVRLGIQTGPPNALAMVAKEKGFFEKQGLNVELKEFTAGKFALEAFLGGSLDFAISGDVPPMLAALQGNRFVVPAQVVGKTTNEVRVVARKEADLNTAEAYFKAKKRKIGTSFGGGPEFFTYEFLNRLGINNKDQVEIVSLAPQDMPAALVSGGVDAIAIFDPLAHIAEKQMGDKAVTFTDENIYSELYVIEANESVKENPATLEKLLSALFLAEQFTKDNPEEAKTIVMKYTKLDKETIDSIWDNFDFRITLTPQLLEFWNREAQWVIDTGKVKDGTAAPNFRDIIFDAPLKKLSPSAVEL